MLVEFVNCGACECPGCLRNCSCPKVGYEEPCVECCGAPPYAPDDIDDLPMDLKCPEKNPSVKGR